MRLLSGRKQRLTMSMWLSQSAGWALKIFFSNSANCYFVVHVTIVQLGSGESCHTLQLFWLL